ncbi:hypothetical protein LB542_03025 [Mesorhizobium sp. BR1-1-9]|uniref:hypothetical protein n=1 Tax=unclassified Mesorhizobium TaxID=325217 RepID=UPI001CD10024|nr:MULTISPECIES: hypothetical protein [unclassified Mesorhizobium]MBZ9869836.1 hypothetical protein [Mesorhizobium sp. BR1-1-9]MBZ9942947.1 hypothetical protein [Mesorhizobium sp. BR1-1-13]
MTSNAFAANLGAKALPVLPASRNASRSMMRDEHLPSLANECFIEAVQGNVNWQVFEPKANESGLTEPSPVRS